MSDGAGTEKRPVFRVRGIKLNKAIAFPLVWVVPDY